MEDYLSARKEADVQHISVHDVLCEKIMLGLRLAEGLDLSALARDYGDAVYDYRKAFSPFIARNLMQEADGRLSFTREGMYVSNAILADVLDFDE
jgi:oxygen-independent coproporphyrinogen-3 oxidase